VCSSLAGSCISCVLVDRSQPNRANAMLKHPKMMNQELISRIVRNAESAPNEVTDSAGHVVPAWVKNKKGSPEIGANHISIHY